MTWDQAKVISFDKLYNLGNFGENFSRMMSPYRYLPIYKDWMFRRFGAQTVAATEMVDTVLEYSTHGGGYRLCGLPNFSPG